MGARPPARSRPDPEQRLIGDFSLVSFSRPGSSPMDAHPEFLELEDVFELHADSIARYGGDLGVRDRELIESAVAVPRL